MSLISQINRDKLPLHVAIIMDGNGRWAQQRGMERIFGHREGVEAVRRVVEASVELNIRHLTLYAFSTENWGRPDDEVSALMGIMVQSLTNEKGTLMNNNIRLSAIGDVKRLTEDVREKLEETIRLTSEASGLNLIIAMSYSSRWEITEATRRLAVEVRDGTLDPDHIDEKMFGDFLTTSHMPDPELMIRTSGELRLSNFLLWQLAYAELYFPEVLWPDFGKEEFYKAIIEFQRRERRFGKTSEQLLEN
ncbi:MAG: isoprenyl transferase [Bacteroidales bacterium]|jgi:undecaprenyl diphosphate synthase|nr:isoprenyl transferase [Bacteroidales bacterium]